MAQQQPYHHRQPQAQILQPVQRAAVTYGSAQDTVMVYGGSGQPVYLQQVQARQEYSPSNAKAAVALGVIQILAGLLSIIFQSAAIWMEKRFVPDLHTAEFPGTGIWCGCVFFICGILGVCSGKKNTMSLIIAFMTFNIFSMVLLWVLTGFAASNLTLTTNCFPQTQLSIESRAVSDYVYRQVSATYYNIFGPDFSSVYYYSEGSYQYYIKYYSGYTYYDLSDCSTSLLSSWKVMDALLLVLSILEFAVALTASVKCCKALGCCCLSQPTFVIQQALTSSPNANVFVQGHVTRPYPYQGAVIHQHLGLSQPVHSVVGAAPNYGARPAEAPYGMQYGMQSNEHAGMQAAGSFTTEAAADIRLQGSNAHQPHATTATSPEYTDLVTLPSYDDVCKQDLEREQLGPNRSA